MIEGEKIFICRIGKDLTNVSFRATHMEEIRVFLLNLNSTSGLCDKLHQILQSCEEPRIHLKQQSSSLSGSSHRKLDCSGTLLPFDPHILFVVLNSRRVKQVASFIRSMSGRPVVAVVEGGESEERVELLKLGIADFVTPPLQSVDIIPRLWRLLRQKNPEQSLIDTLNEKLGMKQLVGDSPAFIAEIEKIPMVAKCDVNVLISGETGTGKELCARAIHYLSSRADKPFVPASCGTLPLELVENELFGHSQGAFTGANASQAGLIHEADGGTLFLDEVDCLPLPAQVKLLRLIQEKEYRQLGSPKTCHADIRVIAATNIELEKAVKEKMFRQDLYYRLNIIPLMLPPLRERKEDVPLLSRHFLEKYAAEFDKPLLDLAPEAIQKLLTYDWPGNVRELENVIERAVVFSRGNILYETEILLQGRADPPCQESLREAKSRAIAQFEKQFIQDLLLAHQGNITKSARAANKNRRSFWELIRKYQIDVKRFKTSLP